MTEIIEVIERYEVPELPTLDLPEEDGIPLETNWHRPVERRTGGLGGPLDGEYLGQRAVWLRLLDGDGKLLPTQGEAGAIRVAELEAENGRLSAELRRLKANE